MPKSEGTYNSFLIDFLIAPKYRFGRHLLLVLFFTFVAFNMPYLTCAGFLDEVGGVIGYVSGLLLAFYLGGIYLHMYVLLPGLHYRVPAYSGYDCSLFRERLLAEPVFRAGAGVLFLFL